MMNMSMNLLRSHLRSVSDEELLAAFRDYVLPELSDRQKMLLRELLNSTTERPRLTIPTLEGRFSFE